MTATSENNKCIAKNTALLYVRMFFIMAVTLYTSRVVLRVLGVEDFGIFNIVAGFVSMLAFFTSSLSNVSQRYLSLGLGCKDIERTTQCFRQSFTLLTGISVMVLIAGETVGLWFVCNKLVIPPSRYEAALWVYQFALVSVVSSIMQVPFLADIIAREKMGIYAYVGIFEAVSRLLIVYVLLMASVDALILYGLLTAVVSVLTWCFYAGYCFRYFPESKCTFYWDRFLAREMSKFVGYNLFGCFAFSAGVQGTNVILNLFFGPVVNAARGIATQISAVVARFSENVMTAVKPQIIKSYASGERAYMLQLVERSSKYSFFLAAFIALPVLFETDYVLRLWLGQVPDYTVQFARLTLCEQLVGVLIPPLWIAANATGKIKNNQVYGRLFVLSALPVSYLLLCLYPLPALPMVVLVFAQIGYWVYCVYDIHKQVGLDFRRYGCKVVFPILIQLLVMGTVGWGVVSLMDSTFLRCVSVALATFVCGLLACYLLLERNERTFFKNLIITKIKKK